MTDDLLAVLNRRSDELLAVLNQRTAIAAVRAEAGRAGLDAEHLLDSATLNSRVSALDVDDPGFPRHVAELVQEHAAARGLAPAAPPPAGRSPDGNAAAESQDLRQWTESDVAALPKTREGARQLQAAIDAGLLTDLGYPPRRRRR
jgi:hypothetical protein